MWSVASSDAELDGDGIDWTDYELELRLESELFIRRTLLVCRAYRLSEMPVEPVFGVFVSIDYAGFRRGVTPLWDTRRLYAACEDVTKICCLARS